MPHAFTTLISPAELETRRGSPGLVIVDCRFSLADPRSGERAYQAGHLPGALYAHLERDLSGPILPGKTGRHPLPDPERLARTLGGFGVEPGIQLVAYDDAGGAMAARLWWLARWLGHATVAVLDGGYPAWVEANLPVSRDTPSPAARNFPIGLRSDWIADAGEVERIRTLADHRVFDARAPERYRGDVEPIDPVAGHIAGARSLPFSDNLSAARFRPPNELRERFLAALDGVPASQAVVYCGSGVTACHDVLAAEIAGLPGVRLYPGSWSEWIVDPKRPTARGAEP